MLANFFGKSNPANLLVIISLFLVLFLSHFFLGSLVDHSLKFDLFYFVEIGLLFALLFFFYIFILAKNKLTLNNSYGFLFFILLFGFFPGALFNIHHVLVTLLLLIYVRRVLSLRSQKSIIAKLYDSGFWLGIIFLIDPFSILFYGLLLASIVMFQKLTIQSFLISFVGILTPVILFFTYCFWFDIMEEFYKLFWLYTDFDFSFYQTTASIIPLLFMFFIAVLAIIIKTPKVLLIRGKFRKFWTWSILYFGLSLLYLFLIPEKNGSELLAIFFPATILFTNLLEEVKKPAVQNVILFLFVLIPILVFIV